MRKLNMSLKTKRVEDIYSNNFVILEKFLQLITIVRLESFGNNSTLAKVLGFSVSN